MLLIEFLEIFELLQMLIFVHAQFKQIVKIYERIFNLVLAHHEVLRRILVMHFGHKLELLNVELFRLQIFGDVGLRTGLYVLIGILGILPGDAVTWRKVIEQGFEVAGRIVVFGSFSGPA